MHQIVAFWLSKKVGKDYLANWSLDGEGPQPGIKGE